MQARDPRLGRRLLKAVRSKIPSRPPSAQETETERPFWGPHPDPDIAFAEDEFYRFGSRFLMGLYAGAMGLQRLPREFARAFHSAPTHIQGWGQIADLFRRDLSPEHLMTGWEAVIDRLVAALFPVADQEKAAQALALRTHLLHRAGQRVALPDTLPTWGQAIAQMTKVQSEAMQWTKVRALEFATQLGQRARSRMVQSLIVSRESGESLSKLQQRLFDEFGEQNRDWRRVALTETAFAASNGQLASVDPKEGWLAEWVAGPHACPFCRKMGGVRLRVVSPDKPSKNWDTEVWQGKHNVGRSAYRYSRKEKRTREDHEMWKPALPAHPNCACSWVLRKARPAK